MSFTPAWSSQKSRQENINYNLSGINEWIHSPELEALSSAWDIGVAPTETAPRIDWFVQAGEQYWDLRRGRERNQVDTPTFSARQESAIRQVAEWAGLIQDDSRAASQPQEYGRIVVLGGLLRGCITRWRFARELVDNGVQAAQIIGLGGSRALTPEELAQASTLGVDAETEFDAMMYGASDAFHVQQKFEIESGQVSSHENTTWSVARVEQSGREIEVVSAPSLDPERRRANTSDSIIWLNQDSRLSGHEQLLITHQIYVPYQASVAVRTLGVAHNIPVNLCGVSSTANNLGPLTQAFELHNYIQEINSTIRGYAELYQALSEV